MALRFHGVVSSIPNFIKPQIFHPIMYNKKSYVTLTQHQLSSILEVYITHERLRQAQLSFNLSLLAAKISVFTGLIGAGLLLSGKLSEGSITTAISITSNVYCFKITKNANDRLDLLWRRSK
jgi:hypothetical protein